MKLTVNGVASAITLDDAAISLLTLLRDELGLIGTKNACEQGECGSCTVVLDGDVVCACLVPAVLVGGSEVVTIEGLDGDERAERVQRALVEAGAVQCGFCTPGVVVMACHALAERADALDVAEALAGNLCRCTGYGRILAALEKVGHERG